MNMWHSICQAHYICPFPTGSFNFCFAFFFLKKYFQIYRGRLENGTNVAIRSLSLVKKCSIQNLKVRLDMLSKLHHPHLVGFLGHSIDGSGQDDSSSNKVFLVYEYVPNGNYRTHLSG